MDSLPSLLYQRSTGRGGSVVFRDEIAVQKSHMELLDHPRIASPHTGGIPALQVDRNEGRFLLSGSSDATVCIYDLSKRGLDHSLVGTASSTCPESKEYKPVARSVRVPSDEDELQIPHGHSHSVVEVQW